MGDGARIVRLRVDGMVCDVCAGRVRGALAAVPGVQRAAVSLGSGEATVETIREIGRGELADAVRGTVLLSWARDVLARLGGRGA